MAHPLDDPWPPFLDWIRSQDAATRDRGLEGLWRFLHRTVEAFPPRALSTMREMDREDVLSKVFLKCAAGAVLRYQNRGVAFGAWLSWVIRTVAFDHLDENPLPPDPEAAREVSVEMRAPEPVPVEVARCIEEQPEHYQRVLRWIAEGLWPREVITLMPGPEKWDNVKIGNLFHAARRSMRKCLEGKGLSQADLIGP